MATILVFSPANVPSIPHQISLSLPSYIALVDRPRRAASLSMIPHAAVTDLPFLSTYGLVIIEGLRSFRLAVSATDDLGLEVYN